MLNLFRRTYAVTKFSRIELSMAGMRNIMIYEIICNGKTAEFSLYEKSYTEEERELKKKASCPADEVIMILNECKISRWDGFHGKHPRHVKDGTVFGFTAEVNNGKMIQAGGSHNFPKRFHIFYGWLREKVI